MKQNNFRNHLRQVLQDSGEGWNVLKLLSNVKDSNKSFDYNIWFDIKNRPIGIAWITSDMRRRLLCFGTVLSFYQCFQDSRRGRVTSNY